MTIEQQYAEPRTIQSELYPSPHDQLVEAASHDGFVIGLAAGFSRGEFDFDLKAVEAVAGKYGLAVEDVTEHACNVSRMRLAEIVRLVLNDEV